MEGEQIEAPQGSRAKTDTAPEKCGCGAVVWCHVDGYRTAPEIDKSQGLFPPRFLQRIVAGIHLHNKPWIFKSPNPACPRGFMRLSTSALVPLIVPDE